MPVQVESFNARKLEPVIYPQDARVEAARLGASLTLAKGTVLAKKTSDNKLYAYAEINQIQTMTFGAAATGGTMRLYVPKANGSIVLTDAITWNTTDATWLAAINTALDAATGVAGGIVATGAAPDTAITFTFSGTGFAAKIFPLIQPHTLPTSVTTVNVVDATVSTGLERACAILMHDVATDASGNHYLGTTATSSRLNLPQRDTSVYVAGCFDTTELVGWDAAAAVDFGARTMCNGYVRIP